MRGGNAYDRDISIVCIVNWFFNLNAVSWSLALVFGINTALIQTSFRSVQDVEMKCQRSTKLDSDNNRGARHDGETGKDSLRNIPAQLGDNGLLQIQGNNTGIGWWADLDIMNVQRRVRS